MARISSYPQDNLVEGTDKLIGTDEDGEVTKTFTLTSIGEWLKYNTQPIATLTSADGTQFIVAAGNDGSIQGIPLDSVAPDITTLPTISGTLNVGETLTAVAGTATGIPAPTRVLQWQRSDNGTTGWADISGATGTTYLLGYNDEDKYIRVEQTEENILGTATVNSASTGQIQPSTGLLLDQYAGAAAAYSLRKLSLIYSGDAIIVRRASDNATQSIGFSSDELDTASLESFCAGTDGFVTTWYDQSGNGYNAVQATAAGQPKIVSAGTFLGYLETTQNQSTQLASSFTYIGGTDYSVFFTAQNFGGEVFGSSESGFFAVALNGSASTSANSYSNLSYYKNSSAIGITWGDMYNATTSFSQISALITRASGNSTFKIGFSTGSFNHGRYKEYIIYPNQTIDRTEVENNIITYYGF